MVSKTSKKNLDQYFVFVGQKGKNKFNFFFFFLRKAGSYHKEIP